MKGIEVVAAIIWNDAMTHLLISQRPQHLHKGGCWEFPGGKVEPGESHMQALARELKEELGVEYSRAEQFMHVQHEYPEKLVSLDFYQVYGTKGDVKPNEGQEWRWIAINDLPLYPFPEANVPVVQKLLAQITQF